MTKAEFYAEVTSISDLIDFCCTYEFEEVVDGIRSSDDFDDWVWDTLEEERSSHYWHEAKDWLRNLEAPSGDYFKITGRLEYDDIYEHDLDIYMERVADLGDQCDFWDVEEEDDDWITEDDDPVEDGDSGDVCWDVSVDLSVLIGVA